MKHFFVLVLFISLSVYLPIYADSTGLLNITSWNVRGYPETRRVDQEWFSSQLDTLNPDILCLQEFANNDRVDIFLSEETSFSAVAFLDSSDGQDNAIFSTSAISLEDIIDPEGFQHPAQAAYVSTEGFNAVIVTVHLSWTDTELRELEKALLEELIEEMLKIDPDVIINGDFNTKEEGIQELAMSLGMEVMIPLGQENIGTTHANNRYDHFLISQDLFKEEAIGCKIITYEGDDLVYAKRVSDHLPVMAVFRTDIKFKDLR